MEILELGRQALSWWKEAVTSYYEGCLDTTGGLVLPMLDPEMYMVKNIATELLSEKCWSSCWLDVYGVFSMSDLTAAGHFGVTYETPATEMQEVDDESEVVPVDSRPSIEWFIKNEEN